MKKLLKLLLLPALCAFFLLQAQQVAAQSKDNDVLVMECGSPDDPANRKTYGIYVYWPDKEVEYLALGVPFNAKEWVANRVVLYKKINELADLGWELDIVEQFAPGNSISTSVNTAYFFKRATPK
jgi:hypothetical protein